MLALSHVIIGASSWGILAAEGYVLADWRCFGLAAGAALLPDLDHPKSWLGRRLPFLSHPLAAIFGHRGVTHSLLAVGLAVFFWVGSWGWLTPPLVVGYLSHLAADGLTPMGVPLLWPSKRRFSLPLCTTGGVAEWAVVIGLTTTSLWLWHGTSNLWL